MDYPINPTQAGGEAAADAPAGRAAAGSLPCLNTINCNEGTRAGGESLSAGQQRTAFALKLNVLWMIQKHGLERIGFLTLTFARHVVQYKEAQKSLHSLMTGVLKRRYPEYIIVMERMTSKRIHYHLLVVMAGDIRTRVDFAAVKGGDYRSASAYLRQEWEFWRGTAPKYGFGRTELMPIRETAEGVAKYVGKYVAKHIGKRLPEDKGARLVRYSKGTNRVTCNFSWVSPGSYLWRQKLATFCRAMGLTEDNHKEQLQGWYGKNWIYTIQPIVASIKLAEFHPATEARSSLEAARTIALAERTRRRGVKRKTQKVPKVQPVKQLWASWAEWSIKED